MWWDNTRWINLAQDTNRQQVLTERRTDFRFHRLGENTEKPRKYLVSKKGFCTTKYVKCKACCVQAFGESSHCSN